MFYSDDPARDAEVYFDYQNEQYARYGSHEDLIRIEKEIENTYDEIEQIKEEEIRDGRKYTSDIEICQERLEKLKNEQKEIKKIAIFDEED